jgi:hypothetical protein
MAPKKFTYTPGTGGGKQTKAFAKKGAASKAASAKDKAALEAWAKSQQARGAFGPVTGAAKPGSTSPKVNLGSVGLGKGGVAGMRVTPTSAKDFTPKRLKKSVPFALRNQPVLPIAEAENIVRGNGDWTDVASIGLSAVPYIGKPARMAIKGGKAIMKPGLAYAATPETLGKTAAQVKAAAKVSAKNKTAGEKATVRAGEAKSKTAETATELEKQAAKEASNKSVNEAAGSTVRPLAPAPAGAKMPTGMTKAEIKKFGEKRSKALGSGGKQGRTTSQRAQVASDIEETIKSQLAARQTGARAGAEIPGELGARRVGGPAADAATAAPARSKPAPKPGPKQALRENAQLTAEPTGKPKVPSARASQAVKDKYAKDLAAYEKQQEKFNKQQAAIKQKTTDIEMGKAKGPSADETGAPMVKAGPAKTVKRPRVTRPKAATPATPRSRGRANTVPERTGAIALGGKPKPATPSAATSASRTRGRANTVPESKGPIAMGGSKAPKSRGRANTVPESKGPITLGSKTASGSADIATNRLKGKGARIAMGVSALPVAGAVGYSFYDKNAPKGADAANAKDAATPPTTATQAKTDARHPSPDVWLDKYGRRITEAEFNRRKEWWTKAKTMSKAEFDKAYDAEVARRRKSVGAAKKKFGTAATAVTMNKEVPKGVAPRIWNSLSESEKTRFQFKYKNNARKAVFDLLKGKQTPNR